MTATPATILDLTIRFESVGDKLYQDTTALSFLPHLVQNYHTNSSD